jgi:antitoxin component YwqK of YwqJK toxin-antitoxin module
MPILTFGQTKNSKDELGRKQGVHSDYSGSWLFERTYRNDTLNGFFRQFTKDGTTWGTGYFKNGLKDSLWLDFYKDRTVEKREFYRNGRKDGEFIEYFKNGHVSSITTFRNDTIVGERINYYINGPVKSKGNPQNGIWIEYYQNGNIKSKQEFVNGNLAGQRLCFSLEGDTLLPRHLKPKLISNDTSIINNTDLKVYMLFDPYDSLNNIIDFGPSLFDNIPVCKNDFLTIHIGTINFLIKQTGLWVYEQIDTTCNINIKVNGYTTNRKEKELKNGDYDISYELEKKYFKSRLGKIEVERKQMQCDDTGRNPMKITKAGKTLLFKDIGNLLFFEFDSDNDWKNELYLLNYFSCEGHLEIYKIDDK